MHVSQQIEIYCTEIRKKFLSSRKMPYPKRVRHVQTMVQYLNQHHERKLNENYLLKIMCLDCEDEYLAWYEH